MPIAGLTFPNRVGLAAGLDKNGRCIDAFGAMGFGFVEVGTVTPLAQPGNPKPRIFRLPEAQALINRLGFNNDGLAAFVANVRQARFRARGGILGLNIGKNAATPIERAADDYLLGLAGVYPHADYVTVNISSPNTAEPAHAAVATPRSTRCWRRSCARRAELADGARPHRADVPQDRARPRRRADRSDRGDVSAPSASTASSRPTRRSRATASPGHRTRGRAAASRARRLRRARTASSPLCAPPSARVFRSSASAA